MTLSPICGGILFHHTKNFVNSSVIIAFELLLLMLISPYLNVLVTYALN